MSKKDSSDQISSKKEPNSRQEKEECGSEKKTFSKRISTLRDGITDGAFRLALKTTTMPFQLSKSILTHPEQRKIFSEAGHSLRDLRKVAGMTQKDLTEALNLENQSVLEAIENGTAVLSFELILRMSALLARHDPIPFILKFTRTYNPSIWKILEGWGLAKIPLQYERERQFINIYRGHDTARKLSDEGFSSVLQYTRAAFEMALHFAAEHEAIPSIDSQESTNDPLSSSADKKSNVSKDEDSMT